MTREPIEVTRQDRIYCLKVSSDYHPEVCEECKFYPNCDHMTQDDMTELTIKDLEALEQEPKTGHWMKSNIGGAKVCSVCNAHIGLSSFKYCPNCGAKMIEPQESEDT